MCNQGKAYEDVMIHDHPKFDSAIDWVRKHGTVGDIKKLATAISASAQGQCKLDAAFEEIVYERVCRDAE